jgi:Flp pilus assembly protein TadD
MLHYKHFFPFFSFVLCLSVSACNHNNNHGEGPYTNSADAYLGVANKLHQSGDFGAAVRFYQQALDIEPDNKRAQAGLAETLAAIGENKASIHVLEKLLIQSPGDSLFSAQLARAYIANKEPQKALPILNQLESNQPQDSNNLANLGVCYDLIGKHDLAQNYYQRSIQLNPQDIYTRSNHALSLALNGKAEEAIKILEKLSKHPQATQRERQNLAVAYGMLGQYDKSNQLFRIDLDAESVRNNLAFLMDVQKQTSEQGAKPADLSPQLSEEAIVSAETETWETPSSAG